MQRFALRFLLPAEILLGLFTLSWGLAGAIGSGRLTEIIQKLGNGNGWAWSLGVIGAAQAGIALAELIYGRDWSDKVLCRVADMRHFAAYLGLIVWLVVMGVFILHEPLRVSTAIMLQSLVLIGANAIVSFHTKRLSVLLDPSVPTTQLRAKMVEARVIRG